MNLIGKTIIPGLIDGHAHARLWAASHYLAWGVTTVRDVNSPSDSAFSLRNDLNLGAVLGPRMFSGGAAIDGVPPTGEGTGVATPAAARHAVDQRAVVNADYVVISKGFTAALLKPLLDEAATLRLSVAADLGKIDALTAARAGIVAIENLSGIVPVEGWARLDSARIASSARALARTHVAIVPVLVVHEALARHNAALRRGRPRQNQFVREFLRAGGVVAAGSGAVGPGLDPGAALHAELALLVAAGFTPLEAIGAATHQAARLLRADSLGWLAPGKVADLVVLDRDPTADISATRNIAWVMTRGRIVSPDSLRKTWPR